MMKKNDGFTLVELLVTIVVGTLVTAAASTLLLLGMRISAQASRLALDQYSAQLVMDVMGNIISQEATSVSTGDIWTVSKKNGDETIVLASYSDGVVSLMGNPLLEEVESSKASLPEDNPQLLIIEIKMADGREYTTSIYCRLLSTSPSGGDSDLQTAFSQRNYEEVLTFALENGENPPPVTEFLTILASQYGSRGQILDEAGEGTGEYFSQWYIGSYEDNPGWSRETPWCACYLSWAMARTEGLETAPRFASVDHFWVDFVTEQNWSARNPSVGVIIFFDWQDDGAYDPEHVGAVIAVTEEWIYTIEGNSGNRVAVCRYEPEDPGILGYGKLNWK